MKKPPKLGKYNGKGDLEEHIQLIDDRLNYFIANKASKYKLFTLTLVRPTRLWFNGLPTEALNHGHISTSGSPHTLPPRKGIM